MWIGLVSIFPEMFAAVQDYGMTRRALERELLSLDYFNPRDYAADRHRTVDDRPYGGGPGMLMKVGPLADAIDAAKLEAARQNKQSRVICMSPQGSLLDQQMVAGLSQSEALILVSGRYEGIDERVLEQQIDVEISIGDYITSGGELPSMILIDAMTRLMPGVLGHDESAANDSFSHGLLDFPQYTRPESVAGQNVPDVLLSGDHKAIATWREKQSLGRTWLRRPDLLRDKNLSKLQVILLDEFRVEYLAAQENGKR